MTDRSSSLAVIARSPLGFFFATVNIMGAAGDLSCIWNARTLPRDTMMCGAGATRSSSRSRT